MKRSTAVLLWLVTAGCVPTITALSPTHGPERTLVEVEGTNLFGTDVVWDAGTATETIVPGGLFGGYLLTVPVGAPEDVHRVALQNNRGRSNIVEFEVDPAPFEWPAPRVDRVSLYAASFSDTGVDPALYVQVAAGDVGAKVLVDGTEVATIAHKGLRNDLYGLDGADLGFPIEHWVSYFALPGERRADSTLSVSVVNLDGQASEAVDYTLPTNAASLDRDGDNLLDAWEEAGYDAGEDGTVDVDLPGLGCDPLRPDILVEVDIMEGLVHVPQPVVFDTAVALFGSAPILNPFADPGIHLEVDTAGTVPFEGILNFYPVWPTTSGAGGNTEFSKLKEGHFDATRRGRVYHYAIWASTNYAEGSGMSDADLDHGAGGDDFLISIDTFACQTLRSQVATFVHELGHGLGQRHGGNDVYALTTPNYASVMSYSWQRRSCKSSKTRKARPTCVPLYWQEAGATEGDTGSNPSPLPAGVITDFSDGMLANVVEDQLDESTGVCGYPVHWNNDDDTTDNPVVRNLNEVCYPRGSDTIDPDNSYPCCPPCPPPDEDEVCCLDGWVVDDDTTDTHSDFCNWCAFRYDGPETEGLMP